MRCSSNVVGGHGRPDVSKPGTVGRCDGNRPADAVGGAARDSPVGRASWGARWRCALVPQDTMYGLIGQMKARPGQREGLLALLLEHLGPIERRVPPPSCPKTPHAKR